MIKLLAEKRNFDTQGFSKGIIKRFEVNGDNVSHHSR